MRRVVFMIFCIILLICNYVDTNAYVTYNNHVLVGGIKNKTYFILPTDKKWRTAYNSAFSNWNNTPTKFSFTEASSAASTKIDCYTYNLDDGANGYTEWYVSDIGFASPNLYNWSWSRIFLNKYSLDKTGITDSFRTGVAGHEIGHAIGLTHRPDPYVIMCTSEGGRKVISPQNDDILGIQYLYYTK